MANWLEKIIPPSTPTQKSALPTQSKGNPLAVARPTTQQEQLTNASVVYGAGASILFVAALFFLFTGRWFTGFIVLLLAVCFLGFALQMMKGK